MNRKTQFKKGTAHIRFLTWTLAVNIVARTGPQCGRWHPIIVVQHFLHAFIVLLVSSCEVLLIVIPMLMVVRK